MFRAFSSAPKGHGRGDAENLRSRDARVFEAAPASSRSATERAECVHAVLLAAVSLSSLYQATAFLQLMSAGLAAPVRGGQRHRCGQARQL
jgi:hypothetical protein